MTRVDVGIDPKAVTEACVTLMKKHSELAVMIWSVDEGKNKALAYAGVPDALQKKLKASDWVKTGLSIVGGKGGGKPNAAQGQGPLIEKVPEAMAAVLKFAQSVTA